MYPALLVPQFPLGALFPRQPRSLGDAFCNVWAPLLYVKHYVEGRASAPRSTSVTLAGCEITSPASQLKGDAGRLKRHLLGTGLQPLGLGSIAVSRWGLRVPAAPAESWGRGKGEWVLALALDSPLACVRSGVALSGFVKPGSNQ